MDEYVPSQQVCQFNNIRDSCLHHHVKDHLCMDRESNRAHRKEQFAGNHKTQKEKGTEITQESQPLIQRNWYVLLERAFLWAVH